MNVMPMSELEKLLDRCEECYVRPHPLCRTCIYEWPCEETDTLRALAALAKAAHVVARMYGETLCQGNEGRAFLDTVDAAFPKEADE